MLRWGVDSWVLVLLGTSVAEDGCRIAGRIFEGGNVAHHDGVPSETREDLDEGGY